MKRIKLEQLNTIVGKPFRNVMRDDDGNAIMDIRKDADGNPIKQIPRDVQGNPVAGVMPEIVYQARTAIMGRDGLLELLKTFFLNMETGGYKMTRQDIIYGTRMFQNIAASEDGILKMDEDIHDWVKRKLQDDSIGIKVFGINLAIIEDALNNFEKLHELKLKDKGAK